jgi:hypothetical protein
MAAVSKGTAHLWHIQAGVGAVTNATVTGFSTNKVHANKGQTINEIGNQTEDRADDLHETGTITLIPRSAYTVAEAFSQITYNSVVYVIDSVDRVEAAGSQVQITYNIWTKEYITLS